jgi:2-haloacid dehalogenase
VVPEEARAVIFDVYGTLFDVSRIALSLHGQVPDPDALVNTWRAKQLEYAFVRAMTRSYRDFQGVTEDALDYAIEFHRLEASAPQRSSWLELWLNLRLFDDVVPLLDAISDRKRVVLSNGTEAMVSTLLGNSGLDSRIDLVLSADAVRSFKPDPSVYALAPAALGIPKEEILFVTANGFDVAGARKFGFTVCRADRAGIPEDRNGWTSHLTVNNFAELEAMFVRSA